MQWRSMKQAIGQCGSLSMTSELAESIATDRGRSARPLIDWESGIVSELVALSAVIAEIYDAAIDPSTWEQALSSICAYVGGTSAALLEHDAATQRSQVLHLFSEDAFLTRLYVEKFPSAHPVFPDAFHLGLGDVATIDDVVSCRQFEKTPFYKQWAEPQGIVDALLVNLKKDVTHACLIDIRTSAAASGGMRNRLAVLVPHLQRAVAGGRRLHRATPPLGSIAQRYGLTAGELRVLKAVLEVNGVRAVAERLGLSQATVKTHLHNLFRKTGTSRQSDLVKLVAGL